MAQVQAMLRYCHGQGSVGLNSGYGSNTVQLLMPGLGFGLQLEAAREAARASMESEGMPTWDIEEFLIILMFRCLLQVWIR